MANGGQWDEISLPIRPGLYLNFVEQALAQIVGGPRGVVGLPIFNYVGGAIEAGKFYVVANEKEAQEQAKVGMEIEVPEGVYLGTNETTTIQKQYYRNCWLGRWYYFRLCFTKS